ncbi:hypothetical protein GGE24_007729 [Bradyrhizobium centrosematis]|nr:hypothetical protein [Bradyrhizobium centrosematis]MCS3778351.1 hypothetical protein [Bradyrhizobium centrosematis]
MKATFDTGLMMWDAGVLLLGATDRAIDLVGRFRDLRCPDMIEYAVWTLIVQRVFGIAFSYEDLNDDGGLRHDKCVELNQRV